MTVLNQMSHTAYSGSSLTTTFSVTSGKGGVGKTTLVANIAYQLSRSGHRVLILDGDWGMANIDVMFGVKPRYNIYHVINGEADIAEAVMSLAPNLYLLAGGSGIYELRKLTEFQKRNIMDQLSQLAFNYDYMIVDTGPGMDDQVLQLNAASQQIFVVITPEPASFTDAYSLIKVMNQSHKITEFAVVCNEVRSSQEGVSIYRRLCEIADRFLNVRLNYLGSVPLDPQLVQATHTQKLVLACHPTAPSSEAIRHLVRRCSQIETQEQKILKGGLQFFWNQLLNPGVA